MTLLRNYWKLIKIVVLPNPGGTSNLQRPIGSTGSLGKDIHIELHQQIPKS